MVAGAEIIHQSIPVLDVQYRCITRGIEEIVDISTAAAAAAAVAVASSPPPSPGCLQVGRGPDAVAVDVAASELVSFRLLLYFF